MEVKINAYLLIKHSLFYHIAYEELDGPAVSALGVRLQKLSNIPKGQPSDG
jgi:hypothetical protein